MSTVKGWSVAIKRDDGSLFLCSAGIGIAAPVWLTYAFAVKHKDDLVAHGFRARVVKVEYTAPRIISKGVEP